MQATTLEVIFILIFMHATSLHQHIEHTLSFAEQTHAYAHGLHIVRLIYKPALSHNKCYHGPSLISTHKCTVAGALTSTNGGMHV
jgi:hypothetical protein